MRLSETSLDVSKGTAFIGGEVIRKEDITRLIEWLFKLKVWFEIVDYRKPKYLEGK